MASFPGWIPNPEPPQSSVAGTTSAEDSPVLPSAPSLPAPVPPPKPQSTTMSQAASGVESPAVPMASTPPMVPGEIKTAADHLMTLQERLNAISNNRSISSIDGLAAASTPPRSPTPPNQQPAPVGATDPRSLPTSQPRTPPAMDLEEEAKQKLLATVSLPAPSDTCPCRSVINPSSPAVCATCNGVIRPIFRLQQDRLRQLEAIVDARKRLQLSNAKEVATWGESQRLSTRITELESIMDEKAGEVDALHAELKAMGERVIEEIEKRAELQVSKDALQDELEELTKGLFEEANMLVSNEARRGHHHEVRVKNLEAELVEIKLQLQMEQLQLRELKVKMDEEAAKNGTAKPADIPVPTTTVADADPVSAPLPRTTAPLAGTPNSDNTPLAALMPDPEIDPLLLAEFSDFLAQSPTVKLNKLHTIPFMKSTKDDDVVPCLRFGGNPRTVTSKLIDAIMLNSCFVEEMTPQQIALANQHLEPPSIGGAAPSTATGADRLIPPAGSSPAPIAGAPGTPVDPTQRVRRPTVDAERPASGTATPTQAIFQQRTVLERLSTWTAAAVASTTSATSNPVSPAPAAGVVAPSTSGVPAALLLTSPTPTPAVPTTSSAASSAPASPSPGASTAPTGCTACARPVFLRYHFRVSEQPDDAWCPICAPCRDRMVAACEFYNFVRHVRQGLYSTRRREDLFVEVMALKRRMFYARIGAAGLAGGAAGGWMGKPRGMVRPDSQLLRDLQATDGEGGVAPATTGQITPPTRMSMSSQIFRFLNGESSMGAGGGGGGGAGTVGVLPAMPAAAADPSRRKMGSVGPGTEKMPGAGMRMG
ncbi:hypothetical protein HDU96_002474 [Phlyctochytrium bullatum]|nr:hypothetical protein HDU96_002474 [Phlyctochytrium bullatum]